MMHQQRMDMMTAGANACLAVKDNRIAQLERELVECNAAHTYSNSLYEKITADLRQESAVLADQVVQMRDAIEFAKCLSPATAAETWDKILELDVTQAYEIVKQAKAGK